MSNAEETKYDPGSFTKNAGWATGELSGLERLYDTIKSAFGEQRTAITRDDYRSNCSLESSHQQLIFLNFFLHSTIENDTDNVTFDQLVRKALSEPHSVNFDYLALFALHLAQMGGRTAKGGSSEGARFTNEFAKNVLWQDGGWLRSKVEQSTIDEDFNKTVEAASDDTIVKCRNNYRFILNQCGLLEGSSEVINTRFENWCADALYLFFDRVSPNVEGVSKEQLVDLIKQYEVHRLLGTTEESLLFIAGDIAESYIADGGLSRTFEGTIAVSTPDAEQEEGEEGTDGAGETAGDDKDDLDGSDEKLYLQRRIREIEIQIRNSKNVKTLKKLYKHSCAFCGKKTIGRLEPLAFYSEAAHIKPVGKPHNGSDTTNNMLILCAEHHLQFDRGLYSIKEEGGSYYVDSKIPECELHNQEIEFDESHELDSESIKWHREFWDYA